MATPGINAKTPNDSEASAVTKADKARIEPTERSIDPPTITNVMPKAAEMSTTDCWRTIIALAKVKNLGCKRVKKIQRTTRANIGIYLLKSLLIMFC